MFNHNLVWPSWPRRSAMCRFSWRQKRGRWQQQWRRPSTSPVFPSQIFDQQKQCKDYQNVGRVSHPLQGLRPPLLQGFLPLGFARILLLLHLGPLHRQLVFFSKQQLICDVVDWVVSLIKLNKLASLPLLICLKSSCIFPVPVPYFISYV